GGEGGIPLLEELRAERHGGGELPGCRSVAGGAVLMLEEPLRLPGAGVDGAVAALPPAVVGGRAATAPSTPAPGSRRGSSSIRTAPPATLRQPGSSPPPWRSARSSSRSGIPPSP